FVHQASRKELAAIGRSLLPPAVMVAPVVWLASELSDGVTGSRFVGKLWDARLPLAEAAAKARAASVLLPVRPEARECALSLGTPLSIVVPAKAGTHNQQLFD